MIGYQSRGHTQLFNFNLYAPSSDDEEASIALSSDCHILGPANETLPYLVDLVAKLRTPTPVPIPSQPSPA
jgi:hypothetical protein